MNPTSSLGPPPTAPCACMILIRILQRPFEAGSGKSLLSSDIGDQRVEDVWRGRGEAPSLASESDIDKIHLFSHHNKRIHQERELLANAARRGSHTATLGVPLGLMNIPVNCQRLMGVRRVNHFAR